MKLHRRLREKLIHTKPPYFQHIYQISNGKMYSYQQIILLNYKSKHKEAVSAFYEIYHKGNF